MFVFESIDGQQDLESTWCGEVLSELLNALGEGAIGGNMQNNGIGAAHDDVCEFGQIFSQKWLPSREPDDLQWSDFSEDAIGIIGAQFGAGLQSPRVAHRAAGVTAIQYQPCAPRRPRYQSAAIANDTGEKFEQPVHSVILPGPVEFWQSRADQAAEREQMRAGDVTVVEGRSSRKNCSRISAASSVASHWNRCIWLL